ncbi:MAG: hypothetical protein IKN04_07425 [Clostridia bacterium]|nr:hypothetical protein [Clostridia bacterium]
MNAIRFQYDDHSMAETIIDLRTSGGFVCALATFAAVQEGHHIRTGRESLLKTGNE